MEGDRIINYLKHK